MNMKMKIIFWGMMILPCLCLLTARQSEASDDPIYQASSKLLSEKGAQRLVVAQLNQRFGKQGWKVAWIKQQAERMTFVASGIKIGPVYTPGRTKIGWIDNRRMSSRRSGERIRIRGYRPHTPTGHPMR